MKATLALPFVRLLVMTCVTAAACGRSDLDEFLADGAGIDDDGAGASGSGRGGSGRGGSGRGGIGNGGTEPASGGASSGRGGAFGGSDSMGGSGNAGRGGAGGASTNGGSPTAGTPGGGAAGVGAVAGSEPRGGTAGRGGCAGSGGSPSAGSGGQPNGFIRCGELLCEPRVSVCCRGGGEFACGATLDECPRLGLACTGASTCDAGLTCCLRNFRATCEPTCEPGDPGPGRGFHLCDSSLECGPEQTCISGPRGLTWCADNFP